jgi:hypothetical protein
VVTDFHERSPVETVDGGDHAIDGGPTVVNDGAPPDRPNSAVDGAVPEPPPVLPPPTRFNALLDDGTSVVVDDASSYGQAAVQNLVLAADRSTAGDCPYNVPVHKGLFKTGDRILVADKYLAWFDYTTDDGKPFDMPPYGTTWERSGALAGWWTLDPATKLFRYFRMGPNGCANWAHNELIAGSASPNQEQHWWDKYAPPLEHTLVAVSGANSYFLSYHYAKKTASSQWAEVLDGAYDTAGVHYKTRARMTSWTYATDVVDGSDANGISNYVDANVEYIGRPDDMLVVWNFSPQLGDVVVNNIYTFLWLAYAQNEDGTACDITGGSQWPGAAYGQPLYAQSSHDLAGSFGGTFAPSTTAAMVLGAPCSAPYANPTLMTTPSFAVKDGSSIRVGESPTLAPIAPSWSLTSLGAPNTGAGTDGDPIRFAWDDLILWNETHDGTLGFGVLRGPYTNPAQFVTLAQGKWYRSTFSLRTSF